MRKRDYHEPPLKNEVAAERRGLSRRRSFAVRTSEFERLRIALGHTEESLAIKAGCSKRTVERAASGRRLLLKKIGALARVLNAPIDSLIDDHIGAEAESCVEESFRLRLVIAGRFSTADQRIALADVIQQLIAALNARGVSVTHHRALTLFDSTEQHQHQSPAGPLSSGDPSE